MEKYSEDDVLRHVYDRLVRLLQCVRMRTEGYIRRLGRGDEYDNLQDDPEEEEVNILVATEGELTSNRPRELRGRIENTLEEPPSEITQTAENRVTGTSVIYHAELLPGICPTLSERFFSYLIPDWVIIGLRKSP